VACTSTSPQLAYVLGAMLGDGYIKKRRKGLGQQKYVILDVKDRDFAEGFQKAINNCLKRSVSIQKCATGFRVEVHSIFLYDLFKQGLGAVERIAEAYSVDFLRGLFDAEGYVTYHEEKNGRLQKCVGLSNSNLELISIAQRFLRYIGIESKVSKQNSVGRKTIAPDGHSIITKKQCYLLRIRRKDGILLFFHKIGFLIKRKEKAIETLTRLLSVRRGLGEPLPEVTRSRLSKSKKGKKRPDMVGDANPAKRLDVKEKLSIMAKERWKKWRQS